LEVDNEGGDDSDDALVDRSIHCPLFAEEVHKHAVDGMVPHVHHEFRCLASHKTVAEVVVDANGENFDGGEIVPCYP
jgi:hypothetical protein